MKDTLVYLQLEMRFIGKMHHEGVTEKARINDRLLKVLHL